MDKRDYLSSYLPQDLLTELFDNQSSTTSTTPSMNSFIKQVPNTKKWKKSTTALEQKARKATCDSIQLPLSSNNAKSFNRSQTQCEPNKGSRKIDTINIDHLKKYGKEPVDLTPSLFSTQIPIKEFLYNSGTKLPAIITSLNGSHFLLQRINDFTEEDIDMFIIFMSKDLIGVMCDVCGHVFIQQMIVMKTNPSQRLEILKLIKPFFIQISSDQYGMKCIQTLIMLIKTKEEEKIIKNATKKYILELSFGSNSSQVIYQLMVGLADKKRNYLIKFISFNFYSFCKNSNGILVLLKFISELKDSIAINLIISVIESSLLQFACNGQLNIIVYQILESFGYAKCAKVINAILNNILLLANNEYGVKVVNKAIALIQCFNVFEYNRLISFVFAHESNLISIINRLHGKRLLASIWKGIPQDIKKTIKGMNEQQTPVCQAIISFDSNHLDNIEINN